MSYETFLSRAKQFVSKMLVVDLFQTKTLNPNLNHIILLKTNDGSCFAKITQTFSEPRVFLAHVDFLPNNILNQIPDSVIDANLPFVSDCIVVLEKWNKIILGVTTTSSLTMFLPVILNDIALKVEKEISNTATEEGRWILRQKISLELLLREITEQQNLSQ